MAGFDIGTLLQAAGEGLVGHKQGQQQAQQQELIDSQNAEDSQLRDLQRQRLMMQIQAEQNPSPDLNFGANRGGVSGRFETEAELDAFLQRHPEPDPATPTVTMNGRRFPDTPEGREAALEWQRIVGTSGRTRPPTGPAGIQDPTARAVDSSKFDLTTGTGAVGVGALGGDVDTSDGRQVDVLDQPELGQDFQQLAAMNKVRQEILAENPGLPREQVEAEARRRIIALGQ